MRSYQPTDASAVLAINRECVPAVGEMDADKLAFFATHAGFFVVVQDDDDLPIGFLIGLDDTTRGYPSPNFAFFADRHREFAYVDRIALAPTAQGNGFGPALYDAFAAWARGQGKPVLTAEVNTIPDNPHSHHFHQRFGFVEVERRRPYGPYEEVAYYEKFL